MGKGIKVIATNRRARHDYHIEDTLEVGLVLKGTEVKSLREGRVNFQDAFCRPEGGEMILYNLHISPYTHGNQFNHDPVRPRKLLMHRREIERWAKGVQQQGFTIIPLKLYFKDGYAKAEIGLAKGKKLYDKRADIAERDTQRRLQQAMRRHR